MPGIILFALCVLAGIGLGMLFYGGLWFTVRALPRSDHPVALAFASFSARTVVVLTGFVLVTAHHWQNAVLCLLGFVLARILLGWWIPTQNAARRTSG
jgi:F1F0 ATPase subunit 2